MVEGAEVVVVFEAIVFEEEIVAIGRLLLFVLFEFDFDFGELEYLQSMLVLIQPVQGFSPLHLVFFRRHSLQALTTLSLFLLVLSVGTCTVAATVVVSTVLLLNNIFKE